MDFKYALRSMRKSPGFTLLAVMVMALGIGANTAVFSVVNAVLLRPLDYRDPDRIVRISTYWKKSGTIGGNCSGPDFHDYHDQSTAFDAMAYYTGEEPTSVTTGPAAEYGNVAGVSPEFFRVMGVEPVAGRLFTEEEEKSGGAVVISESYWRDHFGGNTSVLGSTIRMNGRPWQIAGVLPNGFHFPGKTDLWYPFPREKETTSRSAHNFRAVGRIKPDFSVEQAQSQMVSIASRLEQQYPQSNDNKSVVVRTLRESMVTNVRTTLYVLLGAVGVVLLIACANVANLLLAKSTSRTREIAIRAAVGASRWRIVRQLTGESLVLAVVAGAAGFVLAIWAEHALKALAPNNIPRLAEAHADGWVLAFTFGVSALSSLLFGLAPAIQTSRVDLNDALKQGAGKSVAGGTKRMRGALVVAEIALSVVLLAGAGLLIRSFIALNNTALGFQPEHVLVMNVSVPLSVEKFVLTPEEAQRITRFYLRLLPELTAMAGVKVGATMEPPGDTRSNGGYFLDRVPGPSEFNINAPQAVFSVIAPGTFGALGIPLRAGRDFNDGDTYEAQFTTIINETLARRSFPGENPIGRQILCGFDSMKLMTIVGVVADIHQLGPASKPSAEIYMPYLQHPRAAHSMSILVRTTGDPEAMAETVRRKAFEQSADVPVKFTTMEKRMSENVAAPRFRTLLLSILAGLAVALAMAGVYGVMAYTVSQRVNEIGLRMALGAGSGDVMKMVLREGLTLAAIGLIAGLAGAFAASRLLGSLLFEVKPNDPATYAAVAIALGVVALAASYIPARRATRVDPLVALRQE
jgi:putative ABC transport system permease protein